MTQRDIFGELMEGVAAMKSHREGKLTLRSFKVEPALLPKVDAKLIRARARNWVVHAPCSHANYAST